jgi:hypothetical protein
MASDIYSDGLRVASFIISHLIIIDDQTPKAITSYEFWPWIRLLGVEAL